MCSGQAEICPIVLVQCLMFFFSLKECFLEKTRNVSQHRLTDIYET